MEQIHITLNEFDDIYSLRPKVFNLCKNIMRNEADAEDMTQEVFLLVWRKLGQFQGRSAIGTWLYRLTVNTCLMELRRRRAKMRGGGVEHTGPDDQTQDVHSFIDVFDIWQAIDLLPSGYRKVLMLAMEGHGHAEIGSQLGITPGTSKSQLFKARAQLAETLNNGRRHSGELNVMGNGHSNKDRRGVQTCAAQRCRARFLKRHIRHEFCSERCRKWCRRRAGRDGPALGRNCRRKPLVEQKTS